MNTPRPPARPAVATLPTSTAHTAEQIMAKRKSLLGNTAARLNALSPLATLSRRYPVARDENAAALTSARQFYAGLKFNLLLRDGQIAAKTEGIKDSSA